MGAGVACAARLKAVRPAKPARPQKKLEIVCMEYACIVHGVSIGFPAQIPRLDPRSAGSAPKTHPTMVVDGFVTIPFAVRRFAVMLHCNETAGARPGTDRRRHPSRRG
jgi:hypothetical protein